MKVMNKKRLFIFIVLFPLMLVSCNIRYGVMSGQNIGNYILKNTPIGSSKDDVIAFIKKKRYEIVGEVNQHHALRGIKLPEEDDPREIDEREASHIYVCIAEIISPTIEIVAVICVWSFDKDDKLIFIDVDKEWNTL
jgi:hypothetical protein